MTKISSCLKISIVAFVSLTSISSPYADENLLVDPIYYASSELVDGVKNIIPGNNKGDNKNIEQSEVIENLYHHVLSIIGIYRDILSHDIKIDFRNTLKKCLAIHEEQERQLRSAFVSLMGWEPKLTPTVKGLVYEAYVAVRSSIGEKGPVKAIKTAEEMPQKQYRNIKTRALSKEHLELIQKQTIDEEYIMSVINSL